MSDRHLRAGDAHDERLRAEVHPRGRVNPTPTGPYGLVVLGGGPAGLVVAHAAAGLGARVALVERGLLGGDCLNAGCVPSKTLLAAARAAHAARGASARGIRTGPVEIDFAAIMERVRRVRADVAPADGVARLEAAGVDVYLGEGRFVGPDTIAVGEARLRFARAALTTGTRAVLPPIPGLADAGALTPEALFARVDLPRRLLVLGAGPIGVELGQAFRRLGAEVAIVEQAARVLPREDPDASGVVEVALRSEGVDLVLGARVTAARRVGDRVEVDVEGEGGARTLAGDALLVALGRRPDLSGLGLEAAGIAVEDGRLVVDDHLRTTNPAVFAAGDVVGSWAFTHTADAMARIVVQNALFLPTARVSRLVVPSVTYSDPEVAHVGEGAELLGQRAGLLTLTVPFADLDRARVEDRTEGFARVRVDGRGRIAAATVVGDAAGDLVHLFALAMVRRVPLGALGALVVAYPTRAEVVRRLGDAYNRRRLTPRVASWIRRWLAWWLRR